MEKCDSSESNKTEKNIKISDKKAIFKNADMCEDMQQYICCRLCYTSFKLWRNTKLKRTSLPTSRKNLTTKKTTQHDMLLLDITLEAMSHTKPSTCPTSILEKWLSHTFTPWKD